MRPFLFRAWHKNTKGLWGLVYFELFNTDNGWIKWDNVRQREVGESLQDDLIEEYTGCRDVKGKKIFEGDILTGTYGIPPRVIVAPVEYDGSSFVVKTRGHTPGVVTLFKFLEYFPEAECVGNIHEDPPFWRPLN